MKKYKCLNKIKYKEKNICIQPVSQDDIEKIRVWRNLQKNFLRQTKNISSKQQREYYLKQVWPQLSRKSPTQILFSIKNKSQIVGYGGLTNISWQNKRVELSFLLDNKILQEKKLYKVYFTEFLNLIKIIVFRELKFMKIFTETYVNRDYHIGILEENGFKLEGILKKHVLQNSRFSDSYMHGLLKQ